MKIIQEDNFADIMKDEVEPYLYAHCRECYITGAKEPERREKNGKLHVKFYETDRPKGVIIISHGFTEGAQKYDEMIYYFLKAGYHVCMPEHMGHGLSYRLTEDPSLVHIDTWKRFVRDFLKVCHVVKEQYSELPLFLFAHSMGGAIGTIAAAWETEFFQKIILSSPMIRPLTGNVPWSVTVAIAQVECQAIQRNPDKCSLLWMASCFNKNELVSEISWMEKTYCTGTFISGRERCVCFCPGDTKICEETAAKRADFM